MEAQNRTKKEIMDELTKMRERIAALEESVALHKEAETAVEEDQEKFRLLFEKSTDAVFLFDGEVFVDCNEAAVNLMDCPGKEQLIGLGPSDFSPERQPDGRLSAEKARELADAAFREGFGRFEWLYRSFDGREIWVEASHTIIPVKGGQVSYNVCRDISGRKRIEEALKKSEAMARTFLDLPLDISLLMDRDGILLDFNENLTKRLGKTREDMIGRCVYDLLPESVGNSRRARAAELLATGRPVRFEDKNGESWYDSIVYPVLDEDGEATRIAVFGYDITERKRVEEALRGSEERYRSIFENAVEGIYQALPEGRYLRVNPAFARMHGFESPEEMIASVTDIAAQIFPSRSLWKEATEILENKGAIVNYELGLYRKDKSRIWVSTNARAVRDDCGKVLYYEGMVKDITERKAAEKALKGSRELFHTVLDGIDAAVYVADMDSYEILFANDFMERIFGDITGQICWKVLQQDQAGPCAFCTNSRLFTPQGEPAGPVTWEFFNPLAGDWIECHDRAIRWLDGRTVRIQIAININARKEAEQALKKAHDELELRVRERTAELSARTEQLNDSNVALKVLLQQRDKDRQDMKERFVSNVKHLVLPYLEDLSGMSLGSRQETLVSIAKANLDQIVSPFLKNMHYQYAGFTPAELRVAGFIKDGKTIKEIANILGVSESAINSHRQHIRNKLGLKDKKVNLRAHLQSLGDMPQPA